MRSRDNPRVNSLGPSGAIWSHRSGSTLAQVMTCCLMAPSHYLTQQWHITWHIHLMAISQEEVRKISITNTNFSITDLKLQPHFPGFNKFNSSPPGQNGRHFTDDISRCIFVNEKFCILIEISLKFVSKGPIDNNPALVYIMTWRRISKKPLSEPMPTRFTDAYMRH